MSIFTVKCASKDQCLCKHLSKQVHYQFLVSNLRKTPEFYNIYSDVIFHICVCDF